MKNLFLRRVICAVTVLAFVLSALAVSSAADNAELTNTIKKIATVDAVDNDSTTKDLIYDYGEPTTINAVQNSDGTYCICLIMADGSLRILELNDDFSVKTTLSVPLQLSSFAAFCKGADGTYYVLFSQPLTVATRNQTALRIVNIGKDGSVIRTLDMSGMASGSWLGISQLNCGNNALSVNDSYLTGVVGRDMFPVKYNPITKQDEIVEGGDVHQASYTFAVDLETFKQVAVSHSTEIPYASHSFHQTILKDGNDFVYVERCDALPTRSHILTKMSGGLEWKKLYQGYSFEFKKEDISGGLTDNNTYGQLGGAVRCGDKYMLVGTYQNTAQDTTPSSANVFVQMFDRIKLTSQSEKYLTSYSDKSSDGQGISTAANPKVVRVNDSYIAIPYMLINSTEKTEEIHVILTDNSGEKLWDKSVEYNSDNPVLPKYGHVFYDTARDSIVWFTITNGKLIANSVELGVKGEAVTTTETVAQETTTDAESSTVPSSSSSSSSAEPESSTTELVITTEAENPTSKPTTPAITTDPDSQTTTQPQTKPEENKETFWDKIVNFFMSIYNFFVSLFT